MSPLSFESVVRCLPLGAAVLDHVASIVYANPAFESVTGRDAATLVGRPFFGEVIDGPDAAPLERRFGDVLARVGESFAVVHEWLRADGDPIAVKWHFSIFEEGGRSFGLALLEWAPSQEELQRQIQDLESCMHAIGNIRHEMNNLLMGLMGHTELLHQDAALSRELRRKVERIATESRRVHHQVEELGSVARQLRSQSSKP